MANDLIRLKIDRDFPLMPWLWPAAHRRDVRALGRFVRLAEGIAASPMLSRSERRAWLAALEPVLVGDAGAGDGESLSGLAGMRRQDCAAVAELRASLARNPCVTSGHARRLVHALARTLEADGGDATNGATSSTWSDVIAYGAGVAAPVGRHLLALFGEDLDACGPPADALCIAMRILRELRDCDDPISAGARRCIPETFMRDASITPRHLRAASARGQTRAVLDRVLDGVDALLADAGALPKRVRNRRLRVYVFTVLCRSKKLSRRFRQRDPLREKVALSRWQRATCSWRGIARGSLGPW